MIGEIIGGVADLGNLALGIANQAYQRKAQQTAWGREDNAVQRRVADLKAAGLSPTLAAGSAAGASNPINVSAPRLDSSNIMHALEYNQAQKQMALTDAQKDLVDYQAQKAEADAFLPSLTVREFERNATEASGRKPSWTYDLIKSGVDKQIAENRAAQRTAEEVERNTNLAREYGVPSNASGAMDSMATARMIEKSTKGALGGPTLSAVLQLLHGFGIGR